MSATIDRSQLITNMKNVASNILEKDVDSIRGFKERQLKAIAQQCELVAEGIVTRQITEETREFFLDGIEDMVLNFVKTLHGLLMATVEKVWNAVVAVIWKAIESATGIQL